MLNYQEIYNLIHRDQSAEACKIALDLLSQPQQGLDEEAIRYRLMRNAYFKLKDKEQLIECGRLSAKYADQYFRDRKILDEGCLNELCNIINERLVYHGENNKDINIWIDIWISDAGTNLCLSLKNSNGDVVEKIHVPGLWEEMKQKIDYQRDVIEWWLYYHAACEEIRTVIKENIPDHLYKEVLRHISGSM